MLPLNQKLTEVLALLGAINPASVAPGTVTSGWVDVSLMHELVATVMVGAFGANATVDAKIQQATSSGGANAKDVPSKAITQLLAAGGNNRQAVINFRAQDTDTENGFHYVQLSITVGTATTQTAGLIQGAPRYDSADAYNAASVAQVL